MQPAAPRAWRGCGEQFAPGRDPVGGAVAGQDGDFAGLQAVDQVHFEGVGVRLACVVVNS